MVTALWVLYDTLVVWWTSLLERKLTSREKAILLVIGLIVATYGGYSEHMDSSTQAAIKGTLQAIAEKVGVSPTTASGQLGEATIKQIDALKARLAKLENQQWPTLSTQTIDDLASALSKATGTHRIEMRPCGTPDCDTFASGLQTAFQQAQAHWSQIPIPVYPLMWKALPGIVISSYGDNNGAAVLHDALKEVLKIEVPVYPYAPDASGPRVKLTIGSKPSNLTIGQQ
jgi:hypothetical protein